MILGLTIHFVAVFGLGLLVQKAYDRWVRKCRVPFRLSIWVGIGLVALQILWFLMPLFNPFKTLELPLPGAIQSALYWWGWFLVLGLGVVAVIGVARTWWASEHVQLLKTEHPMMIFGSDSTIYSDTESVRMQLEEEYRRFTGNPRLQIRFSEYLEVPLVTGLFQPTIIVPVRLLVEPNDAFLETFLDHQADHVKLRHHIIYWPLVLLARLFPFLSPAVKTVGRAMLIRVDSLALERDSNFTWSRYKHAFRTVLKSSLGCSMLFGIPQHPKEIRERFRRLTFGDTYKKGYGLAILMLLLVGFGLAASFVVGHLSPYAIQQYLARHQISGYTLRVFDPNVRVVGLPNKGGVIGDGIVIDTTNASSESELTSVGVNMAAYIPRGAEAVEITCDYRVESPASGADTPTISTRSMWYDWNEGRNLHSFWVYDFRWAHLSARTQTRQSLRMIVTSKLAVGLSTVAHKFEYSPHEEKDHGDYLAGPDIAVPPGWRVTLTNWQIHSVPSSTVPLILFPGNAQGFVDWYQRHSHKTPINLRW